MGSLLIPVDPPDPSFDALVAEGLALVPAHAPEWTNHNASDPGITLLELLAYFTDALLYRLGRVSTGSRLEFLRLLRGNAGLGALEGHATLDPAAVRAATDEALDELSRIDCAVTLADHEALALHALAASPHGARARVRCLPRTNLDRATELDARFVAGQDEGHVSVIVFAPPDGPPGLVAELLASVRKTLEPRRLLTSRVHVVAPVAIYLGIRLQVSAWPGTDRAALAARIIDALQTWRPEEAEAIDGTLALAEMADRAAIVAQVVGIDGIALTAASWQRHALQADESVIGLQIGLHSTLGRDSRLSGKPPISRDRLVRDDDGALAAIALRPWEVPRLVLRVEDLTWTDALAAGGVRP